MKRQDGPKTGFKEPKNNTWNNVIFFSKNNTFQVLEAPKTTRNSRRLWRASWRSSRPKK